jgi:DNA repair exonuclease SbcCD ATPase subunit
VRRENLTLTRQLNELKENSEKEIRDKNENILRLNNLLTEKYTKESSSSVELQQALQEVERREKELLAKGRELNEVTLVLSKRDKEILGLKRELEQTRNTKTADFEEVTRMKDYIRVLETEYKQKKENNEGIIERLKEFTCMTLKLQGLTDALTWETSLTRAITASANEHINFQRAVQGQRILFMPHSPGIYISLLLKQVAEIDVDL